MAISLQGAFAGAKQKPAEKAAAKSKPKAPVMIQAYFPVNSEHKFIKDYMEKFVKAHPKEVSLEFYDIQSPAGRKAWMKTGLTCAGVFINGKTKWNVKRAGGKTESVDFLKRMDVYWTRKDFETVVNQILAEAKKKGK
jgi:hypothetical protein